MFPSLKVQYFCPHCSSHLIIHEGWAQWRADTQNFDLIKISSQARCLKCEARFAFIAPKELTPEILEEHFPPVVRETEAA